MRSQVKTIYRVSKWKRSIFQQWRTQDLVKTRAKLQRQKTESYTTVYMTIYIERKTTIIKESLQNREKFFDYIINSMIQ